MKQMVTVSSLKAGDRFEFITPRSEWADNCFLPHPRGIIIVAKSPFLDCYNQCRFAWRLEKYPESKPQDWWGGKHVEVRLLGRSGLTTKPAGGKPKKRSAVAAGE